MSDSLRQDSIAVSDCTEAVHRARHLADVVDRGATALRNQEQIPVSGMVGNFPEDGDRQRASENDLSGDEWPAAQQIADVLLNCQSGQASAGARIHCHSR